MEILLWSGVLLASLYFVVKSAAFFTKYSEKLGLALGLSSFVIGASIVAIGTSLPELTSSFFAVVGTGETEFVVDNIVGSNVANALLILGLGALYAKTLKDESSLIDIDLPFFFSSAAIFLYFAMDQKISFIEGLFLLGLFVIFLFYTVHSGKLSSGDSVDKEELKDFKSEHKVAASKRKKKKPFAKWVFYIVLSMIVLAISAKYLIDSVLELSDLLGVESSVLTITVVAFGTSLPEILTSINAIKRGNHGMAIGNVFGSNTFNLLLVGGLPALFSDLQIADLTFVNGLPYLLIATFAAIFTTIDDKVRLWEGASMLFLYVVFLSKVIGVI